MNNLKFSFPVGYEKFHSKQHGPYGPEQVSYTNTSKGRYTIILSPVVEMASGRSIKKLP